MKLLLLVKLIILAIAINGLTIFFLASLNTYLILVYIAYYNYFLFTTLPRGRYYATSYYNKSRRVNNNKAAKGLFLLPTSRPRVLI